MKRPYDEEPEAQSKDKNQLSYSSLSSGPSLPYSANGGGPEFGGVGPRGHRGPGSGGDNGSSGDNGGNGVNGGNPKSKANPKATPKAKGNTITKRVTRSDTKNNGQEPNKRRKLDGHFSSEIDVMFFPPVSKANLPKSASVSRSSSVPIDLQDLDQMIQNVLLSDETDFKMFNGGQSVPTMLK